MTDTEPEPIQLDVRVRGDDGMRIRVFEAPPGTPVDGVIDRIAAVLPEPFHTLQPEMTLTPPTDTSTSGPNVDDERRLRVTVTIDDGHGSTVRVFEARDPNINTSELAARAGQLFAEPHWRTIDWTTSFLRVHVRRNPVAALWARLRRR